MATIQRNLPFGPEKLVPFTNELFDRQEEKATRILFSILQTRSPRKSDWSQVFSESSEGANYYRTIDRARSAQAGAQEGADEALRSPEEPLRLGRSHRNTTPASR